MLLNAENDQQFLLGIVIGVVIILPLIATGLIFVARYAAKAGKEAEAEASTELLEQASTIFKVLTRGKGQVGKADPHGDLMERLAAFDLNTITMAGWLLLIATVAFIIAEIFFFSWLINNFMKDIGPLGAILFFVGFAIAIIFFCLGRLLFYLCGIPFSDDAEKIPVLRPYEDDDEENDWE